MLKIKNLCVYLNDKQLLDNISMTVAKGSIHRLAGHNGSGKSTLVNTISGNLSYVVKSGQIIFDNEDITNTDPTTRALKGIFLGAQNVPEIPGLTLLSFLKHSLSAQYRFKTGHDMIMQDFLSRIYDTANELNFPTEWLDRYVNVGFSGGEKKRIMLLRLVLTQPKLAILDEPDSGADAYVQQQIIKTIKSMPKTTFIIISHQDQFAKSIGIDQTTTLEKGKIVL
ncbi:MAG: ATP-binding cassette domain-containing protein [Alphaproteobacteria bacterium]|nr:ATP-binding cassette domain-containing protein [Alphaproteobacteria bacterium]